MLQNPSHKSYMSNIENMNNNNNNNNNNNYYYYYYNKPCSIETGSGCNGWCNLRFATKATAGEGHWNAIHRGYILAVLAKRIKKDPCVMLCKRECLGKGRSKHFGVWGPSLILKRNIEHCACMCV